MTSLAVFPDRATTYVRGVSRTKPFSISYALQWCMDVHAGLGSLLVVLLAKSECSFLSFPGRMLEGIYAQAKIKELEQKSTRVL